MASPKEDCEQLMNAALPFAERMLRQEGEFYPYGAVLGNDGRISDIAGYDGKEHPASANIIKLIHDGFVQEARTGKYKATALVYDVKVAVPSNGVPSDAIAVALDHRDDYSVIVYFPYQLKNGHLTLGEAFAQKGKGDVFLSP